MAPNFEIFWKIEIMRMISFSGQISDWNSRSDDCCAGWLGDDTYTEIDDVHSSRVEDCEPMRMASMLF